MPTKGQCLICVLSAWTAVDCSQRTAVAASEDRACERGSALIQRSYVVQEQGSRAASYGGSHCPLTVVVHGEFFRTGSINSRATDGDAQKQLLALRSILELAVAPLACEKKSLLLLADVHCGADRRQDALKILHEVGFEARVEPMKTNPRPTQTKHWLSTLAWIKSRIKATEGERNASPFIFFCRADAFFHGVPPWPRNLSTTAIYFPWFVAHNLGTIQQPVGDSFFLVGKDALSSFEVAIKRLSVPNKSQNTSEYAWEHSGEYWWDKSLHALPDKLEAQTPLFPLYRRPSHNSNPQLEWNPLFTLIGRPGKEKQANATWAPADT